MSLWAAGVYYLYTLGRCFGVSPFYIYTLLPIKRKKTIKTFGKLKFDFFFIYAILYNVTIFILPLSVFHFLPKRFSEATTMLTDSMYCFSLL